MIDSLTKKRIDSFFDRKKDLVPDMNRSNEEIYNDLMEDPEYKSSDDISKLGFDLDYYDFIDIPEKRHSSLLSQS